ncbi:MAG: LPS assembly lipoprotein LptE [Bacteroidales bacterium]|nr:LPS assembly lipoprotein LptE [Bacteroidales bacterium]
MISHSKKINRKFISIVKIFFVAVVVSSCFTVKYDSRGGMSIHPDIKEFTVQYFDNRSTRVNPTLSQRLTEGLQDYIEGNTNLRMVQNYGDVEFSGVITDYKVAPAAISSGDQPAQTRFTITVKVKYKNTVEEDSDFEETFSKYRDYAASSDFTSVEEELSEEILEEIIELVFNKAFVNW